MTTEELYRIRKSWNDSNSQIGAYSILTNAKKVCDKAGKDYKVFNSKGEIVYPVNIVKQTFKDVQVITRKVDPSTKKPPVVSTPQMVDTPQKIWNYLKSQGLTDCGAAGLMGNLYAESGLNPTNLQNTYEKTLGLSDKEYTAAVDNGTYANFIYDQAGYGLAQWTYWSLKRDLYNFLKDLNKSIGDLDGQLEFLVHQLSTEFKSVWTTLKTTQSIQEASNAVLLKFERPADQSEAVQNKRASYGQKYYDTYASSK